MSDTIHVIYARKPCDWHEIESGSRRDCGTAYPTEIVETKEMTAAEYDTFVAKPLASREWLAGKGGWKNNNVRYAIAVTAPERETLFVDPSGSDYGRYVGRRIDCPAVKYPDISGSMVRDKLECIIRTGAEAVVVNDTGCIMNITGALRRRKIPIRVVHLARILSGEVTRP